MKISIDIFGEIDGSPVTRYSLDNGAGMLVRLIDYGGIITELHAPGRNGCDDVVLGYQSLQGYIDDTFFLGATIGRCSNRISNSAFTIDGLSYTLEQNEPPNHLHGGNSGFHRQLWNSQAYHESDSLCLRLHRISPHLEGGYPGNLEVSIIYRLTSGNQLSFEVEASTDIATPVSVTQHSYFNLNGHGSGTIADHQLHIWSDEITPVNHRNLPTGEITIIAGTPFDFSKPRRLGEQQTQTNGLDVNYCIKDHPGALSRAALLTAPHSGRSMLVETTLPGIQLYDGSYLDISETAGKERTAYPACSGLCLESQHYPDAVNKNHFPSPVLYPGTLYRHQTRFTFSIMKT